MRTLTVMLLLVWMAGCAPANRDDLVKEVVKADPEFKVVLDKHQELAGRIQTYERELALKRTTVEKTIAQLRKDLTTATASVKSRSDEVRKRMEPDRQRLQLALTMSSEELRTKRLQRASLGRSIAQLRKALNSKDSQWTGQELARQQAQLEEMLRDAKRLDQELDGLKEHVRLLKVKLLLIKL